MAANEKALHCARPGRTYSDPVQGKMDDTKEEEFKLLSLSVIMNYCVCVCARTHVYGPHHDYNENLTVTYFSAKNKLSKCERSKLKSLKFQKLPGYLKKSPAGLRSPLFIR